jgi:hypothetical protein
MYRLRRLPAGTAARSTLLAAEPPGGEPIAQATHDERFVVDDLAWDRMRGVLHLNELAR